MTNFKEKLTLAGMLGGIALAGAAGIAAIIHNAPKVAQFEQQEREQVIQKVLEKASGSDHYLSLQEEQALLDWFDAKYKSGKKVVLNCENRGTFETRQIDQYGYLHDYVYRLDDTEKTAIGIRGKRMRNYAFLSDIKGGN